jgi:signal transduction histidine kinase
MARTRGALTERAAVAVTTAFELSTRPNVERDEFIARLLQFIPGDRTAVLLWLLDTQWQLLVLSRYSSNVTTEPVPSALKYLTVASPSESSESKLTACPEVRSWAQMHRFADGCAVLPVALALPAPAIGYVQLLSNVPIGAADLTEMEPICEALASFIERGRQRRRLTALENIQSRQTGNVSLSDRLDTAAQVVLANTSAKGCLIFREVPDGGFRADAIVCLTDQCEVTTLDAKELKLQAQGVSVIRKVAELGNARRVPVFYNDEMRAQAFGDAEHDEQLGRRVERKVLSGEEIRSVLIAPVVFEKHPLAVVVLLNKRADSHLGAVFSETDEFVLVAVCEYLSGVLPSIVMNEAMRAIGEIVTPTALSNEQQKAAVYNVMKTSIPGVVGAVLIRRHRTDIGPTVEVIGGNIEGDFQTLPLREVTRVSRGPTRMGERFAYATEIAWDVLDIPTYLGIEMTRDFLCGYEVHILNFFARELLHALLLEQNLLSLTGHFAELRHALRTGLTGVVGYVEEALGCYELYKGLNYAPSVLSQARFRKALERANLSAKTTHFLLEDSRLLLGQFNRANLRVGSQSVSRLVRKVLVTLRHYANERRVRVVFQNAMPEDLDVASFDSQLIEMAMFNIVENAIKYSHREQNVIVMVAPKRSDWVVDVTNRGTYIRPEDVEAIFEPFVRRSTGRQGDSRPGTGLGLAVTKRIVEAHGGGVDVRSVKASDEQADTRFSIRVPRVLPRGTR